MKQYLLLAILLELSRKKMTTAKEIASKFEISQRSVYRYLLDLESAGIKTFAKIGKNGGIGIEHDFALEGIVLTEKEKSIINNSLSLLKENEDILSIKQKLNLKDTKDAGLVKNF